MRPKKSQCEDNHLELGKTLIESFINMNDELVLISKSKKWDKLCKRFGEKFDDKTGRPGLPMRLMIGLTFFKYLNDLSDKKVIKFFLHSAYVQYFCGYIYFQTRVPLEESSLTRFRERLGEEGAEELLKETIELARRLKLLKEKDLRRVIVDTTVQEKNVSYPTDAGLINGAREKLVKEAKKGGIKLRQSYKFVGKRESVKSSKYFHANQYKRGKSSLKKQRTWLGRVIRDIESKSESEERSTEMRALLEIGKRVFYQERQDKGKIYSLHESHVECISKGKARSKYEFGNKVSVVVSGRGSWLLGAKSFFGNPYDGKTLSESISQVESLTGKDVRSIAVDKGYRGKKYHPEGKQVLISGMRIKDKGLRKFLKRRSSIEPVIGHLKQDHRLGRNKLGGIKGDKINVILAATAFNIQKILREFIFAFFKPFKNNSFSYFFFQFST